MLKRVLSRIFEAYEYGLRLLLRLEGRARGFALRGLLAGEVHAPLLEKVELGRRALQTRHLMGRQRRLVGRGALHQLGRVLVGVALVYRLVGGGMVRVLILDQEEGRVFKPVVLLVAVKVTSKLACSF